MTEGHDQRSCARELREDRTGTVTRSVVVPTQLVADAEPIEGACPLPDDAEDARLLVVDGHDHGELRRGVGLGHGCCAAINAGDARIANPWTNFLARQPRAPVGTLMTERDLGL